MTDSREKGVLTAYDEENAGDPTNRIRSFVSKATGIPIELVRRKYLRKPGNRPSLETDWCTVYVSDIKTNGHPFVVGVKGRVEEAEEGYEVSVSHQTLSVSVEFYGANAPLIADRFRETCWIPQNVAVLKSVGLMFQSVDGDIKRLPDFAFEQWIDRYEVRLKIGRKVSRKFGVRDFAVPPDLSINNDLE